MRRALLLALFLIGCAEKPEELIQFQCFVYASCGTLGDVFEVPVCGTYEDVQDFSRGWSDACTALTLYKVRERVCPYVVCAVRCPIATSAIVDACP